MQYSDFEAEDFCKDVHFIRWAQSPAPDSDPFWNSFLEAHPHKAEEINTAREYVRTIGFAEIEPDAGDLGRLKQRIWTDIEEKPTVPLWKSWKYMAAASVLFALFAGLWFLPGHKSMQTHATSFGQIRHIILEDGSKITLNARSELRVKQDLANTTSREVWLDGEAYFEISKRKGAKFIVHTPETEVEVLGTEFNVSTRRKQTQVVLSKGKVQLLPGNLAAVVMRPGDMAIVKDAGPVQLRRVAPEHYDAWKESYIVMDDKPVSEIADMLADTYGIKVRFQDTSLLSKKLSGKLLIKNPEEFLENLSTILETDLQKNEDEYLFR